jgi:hypothetical protein
MPLPSPAQAEERLLRLLADSGLPPPDEVRHRPGEVVLLYHEKKLALVFELSAPWPEEEECPGLEAEEQQ